MKTLAIFLVTFAINAMGASDVIVTNNNNCVYIKYKSDSIYQYKHKASCTNSYHTYRLPFTLR